VYKESSYLCLAVSRLFKSLNADEATLNLVEEIQTQLEKGHTAIKTSLSISEQMNKELISLDGSHGYIVLENGLSGYRRFYNQEKWIKSNFLETKLHHQASAEQIKLAIQQVAQIIDYKASANLDLQWQASISFLSSARFILNGGPGTGKTTTVVRMLLLYFLINPTNKVALTAPTGKAANRMIQSLIMMLDSFDSINKDLKQKLLLESKTLHRLLGYNPKNNKLKYHQDNFLAYDLVIVDEASMLDVSLTHGLIKALKPEAQLLLIGDTNQLPAVDAGNVFADLCRANKTTDLSINLFKHFLEQDCIDDDLALQNHYVELNKNYRFEQGSQVALLCEAIKQKDINKIIEMQNKSQLQWQQPETQQDKKAALKNWFQSQQIEDSCIILSPVNKGTNSVDELNSLALQILHPHKQSIMQENMPILITQNDYTLNVFNGDIGYLTKINNQWHIAFKDFSETRLILASAIKHWNVAYAISIHKSQGSEYDHVLIALPEDPELEILSNQLLYTAASRAKKSVTLWSSQKILNIAIQTHEQRVTFMS
jgi:exodeoxyribonuclease V alpha subunit